MWLLFGYFSLSVRVSLGFRQAHNLKVAGSNPAPATKTIENTHTAVRLDGGFFQVCLLPGFDDFASQPRLATLL